MSRCQRGKGGSPLAALTAFATRLKAGSSFAAISYGALEQWGEFTWAMGVGVVHSASSDDGGPDIIGSGRNQNEHAIAPRGDQPFVEVGPFAVERARVEGDSRASRLHSEPVNLSQIPPTGTEPTAARGRQSGRRLEANSDDADRCSRSETEARGDRTVERQGIEAVRGRLQKDGGGDARRLRTAIVGCGKIADAHLSALQHLESSEVVATVDVEPALAEQAAARFDVPYALTSIDELIEVVRPEIVHITAPPTTHLRLATRLLQAGCHLYIEKPFAIDSEETASILTIASDARRLVCPGFDHLYEPSWLTVHAQRERVGEVRHLDLVFGYPLGGAAAREMRGDPAHWVWALPAQLLQNVVVHPLYLMLDWLHEPTSVVHCSCDFEPDALPIPTRLRMGLRSATATAELLFSTRIRPQRRIRVFGTIGEAHLDLDAQSVTFTRAPALPGALGRVEAACRQGFESGAALARASAYAMRGELQSLAGLSGLVRRFHSAVAGAGALPVENSLLKRTAALMDVVSDEYARTVGSDATRRAVWGR